MATAEKVASSSYIKGTGVWLLAHGWSRRYIIVNSQFVLTRV